MLSVMETLFPWTTTGVTLNLLQKSISWSVQLDTVVHNKLLLVHLTTLVSREELETFVARAVLAIHKALLVIDVCRNMK